MSKTCLNGKTYKNCLKIVWFGGFYKQQKTKFYWLCLGHTARFIHKEQDLYNCNWCWKCERYQISRQICQMSNRHFVLFHPSDHNKDHTHLQVSLGSRRISITTNIRCKQIWRRLSVLSMVLGPSCAKSSSHHATGCWVANIEQGYHKWNVSRSKR